jgi:hypothetical protein
VRTSAHDGAEISTASDGVTRHSNDPLCRYPHQDHLADPLWIGEPLLIHGEVLLEQAEAEVALEPNTTPHLPA